MTEASKRSLRTRRPPQHFNDVTYPKMQAEDTEGHGYTRMGNPKEYSSPAQELNSIAKLMSKFVNSANKRLKEDGLPEHPNLPTPEAKENTNEKDKPQILNYPPKKKNGVKLLPRNAGNNLKDQLLEQNQIKPIPKKPQNTTKDKSKPKQSNTFADQQSNANYLSLANQFAQQKPALSHFDREATQKAILQQQQMLLNSNNFHRSQLFAPQKVIEKAPQNKDKLFGRSSFHVAIAYHIHLKNVKESGADISSQSCLLDPTYYAKKLKGETTSS